MVLLLDPGFPEEVVVPNIPAAAPQGGVKVRLGVEEKVGVKLFVGVPVGVRVGLSVELLVGVSVGVAWACRKAGKTQRMIPRLRSV
jgi:hypothetical protein